MNKFLRIILFMYVVAACSDDNNTVQIVTENNFSLLNLRVEADFEALLWKVRIGIFTVLL